MAVRDLFDKRILFLTGKGGVGKTTVATALAFAARDMGKNVILIEVDESPTTRYIFSREIPVYKEVAVEERFTILTLDPQKALEEYVGLELKVQMAAKMILNNRIFQYFMQAAPGWRELVTVGKIWYVNQQTTGRGHAKKPKYDMIIVDAPATGHGLSFLKVPSVFLSIIKFGRMQGQTMDLQRMLTDEAQTAIGIVTLPEEMPVNEASTLFKAATESLAMHVGALFINGVHPEPFSDPEVAQIERLTSDQAAMETLAASFPDQGRGLFFAADDRSARAAMSRHYMKLAMEKMPVSPVVIAHQPMGRVDLPGVKEMARIIAAQAQEARP
ncbi:MAG: ArsA family ATPase [Thermodesulfobacteriota bacterium]